jgi:hypothetical protein
MEHTLAAHPAVEDKLLAELLPWGNPSLDTAVSNSLDNWFKRFKKMMGVPVSPLQ